MISRVCQEIKVELEKKQQRYYSLSEFLFRLMFILVFPLPKIVIFSVMQVSVEDFNVLNSNF